MYRVFVYGTLTDPGLLARVLDDFEFESEATLSGLHRVDAAYPTLAPGGSTEGRLLRTPNLDALDAYEGVDRGLYARVSIPAPDGSAECYIGNPARLGADGVEWPGDGPFEERVREYVAREDVVVHPG